MKVLVLSNLYPPDFVGGYELACAQVVDALRQRDHDVRVLTAAPLQPVPASPPHVLRRFKLVDEWSPEGMRSQQLAFRLNEAESRLVNAYNIHALTEVLEDFEPDVVYVCCVTGLGGMAIMACLQYLKVPWVWQLGDRVPFHLCSTHETIIRGLADAFSRRIHGHYIVVSNQLRREIEASGIKLNGTVEILPNWIRGNAEPLARSFYNGGHLRIMSAGRVSKSKGIDVLVESAERLRRAGIEDFSVDVYGMISEREFIQHINRHSLGKHVRLMGPRPHAELLALYRRYDVFAFPTVPREPFGLVPLEAVARGCVPIVTGACGMAEWLVHGVHCLKAKRTPEAFAQVYADVISGRVALEPIARRGAVAAWRDFHLDRILPKIEQALIRAAEQPRAGAGSAADAYRMARMAEQLTGRFLEEAHCA